MISDIRGYHSRIFAFRELSVSADVPSRAIYMISDTQGHRSRVSALRELLVDARVI